VLLREAPFWGGKEGDFKAFERVFFYRFGAFFKKISGFLKWGERVFSPNYKGWVLGGVLSAKRSVFTL